MRSCILAIAAMLLNIVAFAGQGSIIIQNHISDATMETLTIREIATKGPPLACLNDYNINDYDWLFGTFVSKYDISGLGNNIQIEHTINAASDDLCGLIPVSLTLEFAWPSSFDPNYTQRSLFVDFDGTSPVGTAMCRRSDNYYYRYPCGRVHLLPYSNSTIEIHLFEADDNSYQIK